MTNILMLYLYDVDLKVKYIKDQVTKTHLGDIKSNEVPTELTI